MNVGTCARRRGAHHGFADPANEYGVVFLPARGADLRAHKWGLIAFYESSTAYPPQSPHRHGPVSPAAGLRAPLQRPAAPGAGGDDGDTHSPWDGSYHPES